MLHNYDRQVLIKLEYLIEYCNISALVMPNCKQVAAVILNQKNIFGGELCCQAL